jgi:GTP cyclohydrolase III
MTRNATSLPDAALRRAANALRKAGNTREAKRLERNLPAPVKRGKDKA